MDAGEDKKVSREEFTSETVRNKLETVKLITLNHNFYDKNTNTKFTSDAVRNKLATV